MIECANLLSLYARIFEVQGKIMRRVCFIKGAIDAQRRHLENVSNGAPVLGSAVISARLDSALRQNTRRQDNVSNSASVVGNAVIPARLDSDQIDRSNYIRFHGDGTPCGDQCARRGPQTPLPNLSRMRNQTQIWGPERDDVVMMTTDDEGDSPMPPAVQPAPKRKRPQVPKRRP